jgi:IrrE N-terminal-like domain
MDSGSRLRQRLKVFGFADPAIDAAWPRWWSDEADSSFSAQTELRFSLARKLGLEPRSLIEEDQEPKFVWRDEARFKRLTSESELERAGITSFGVAVGNLLIAASTPLASLSDYSAISIRRLILRGQDYVRLADLLSFCWSIGIPTIHLRVFPWPQKRMSAMTLRRAERHAILLAKDSLYPAHAAFYLAHEIGHALLGHLKPDDVLVDLEDDALTAADTDPEEASADRFALELLTGEPTPKVLSAGNQKASAASLADAVLRASKELRIEPGTLALCFGYSTGNWRVANAAIQLIYSTAKPVWREVNRIALGQLDLDSITEDSQSYLSAIMGEIEPR